MQFEWDKEKAASNLRKHGVSFEEASTVWKDFFFIDLYDDEHSETEKRYLIIGESVQNKLLIVSYTDKGKHNQNNQRAGINIEGKKRL